MLDAFFARDGLLTKTRTLVVKNFNENELNGAITSALIKSACSGNASHQVDLAYRYLTGYGFEQSITDGYAWAYVATQKGS